MNFSKYLLIILLSTCQTLFGQDLAFTWSNIGAGGGAVRSNVQVDSNLFYTAQMPKGVGMLLNMIEYDQESKQLKAEKITKIGKKQLATVGQVQSFNPFTIGDGVFTFDGKAKDYEVKLLERDRMTMEILGEPIVLVDYSGVKGAQHENVIVLDNEREFVLLDSPWFFPWRKEKKNQKLIRVHVFDNKSKKRKYNYDIELPSDVEQLSILSREFDKSGNAWVLASTSTGFNNDQYDPNNLNHEYFVWKVNSTGVELFRGKVEAQMLKATLQISEDRAQIRSLISDKENGLSISLFSLSDGEIVRTDSHPFKPSELFEGNERKVASRFRSNLSEAEKLRYGFYYLDHHDTKDGGGVEVMNLSFSIKGNDRAYGTMVYKYNNSGEIVWKRSFPAPEIIMSWVGTDGEVNVLINDVSSRYENGEFVGYSQEKVNAPQSPVHLVIDANGDIIKRYVISNGMEKGELFASGFGFQIDESTFIVGKKGDQGLLRTAVDNMPVVFGIITTE